MIIQTQLHVAITGQGKCQTFKKVTIQYETLFY